MASEGKSPDYYPLRWKVADAVEDLFVLHRGKAAAGVLLLLAGLIFGFIVFTGGGDGGDAELATTDGTTSVAPTTSEASTTVAPTTTESTTTTVAPTTTEATTTTTTTTTIVEVSARAPENDAERDATSPGAIIEMGPSTVRLVGGFATDREADETLTLANAVFPGVEVVDDQLVDESYEAVEGITFRLSAADLFGYNSDNINGTYLPVIDQLAAAMVAADTWQVQVTGHTDDTGPSDGNQRLSEGRAQAAANRLIDQGVATDRITVLGLGEDQPIETNSTEAGRLANRRVEFVVTP